MYRFLKTLLRRAVPQAFLVRHELAFRRALAVFYRGSRYACPLCGGSWRAFVELGHDERLCPGCGSMSRTRRLYALLQSEGALRGEVLHFSPSRSLYRVLRAHPGITYLSTDFEDEFIAEHRMDITALPLPDASVDTVICYHILEHVPDDAAAMRELARVLRPGGRCFIQTPYRAGPTYEDPSVTTEEGRLAAFGQRDHVRVYSVDGLVGRLERAGLSVDRRDLPAAPVPYGLRAETVLLASPRAA